MPEGGPLEELSFRAGGSNRKVMVTADTRGHGECDGGPRTESFCAKFLGLIHEVKVIENEKWGLIAYDTC